MRLCSDLYSKYIIKKISNGIKGNQSKFDQNRCSRVACLIVIIWIDFVHGVWFLEGEPVVMVSLGQTKSGQETILKR